VGDEVVHLPGDRRPLVELDGSGAGRLRSTSARLRSSRPAFSARRLRTERPTAHTATTMKVLPTQSVRVGSIGPTSRSSPTSRYTATAAGALVDAGRRDATV
jgi:hypothetical protein